MNIDFEALRAPFVPQEIEWRVGATNRDKTKGLALAYMNARVVMDRLDKVCGPAGWQDRYPHVGGKTCCEIGLKIGDEWVWKSDGAGDTDYEADKGAFSDAFKRAAVRWGIGRYLYALQSPWVQIEQRGKSYVIKSGEYGQLNQLILKAGNIKRGGEAPTTGPLSKSDLAVQGRKFAEELKHVSDQSELDGLLHGYSAVLEQLQADLPKWMDGDGDVPGFTERINLKQDEIEAKQQQAAAE